MLHVYVFAPLAVNDDTLEAQAEVELAAIVKVGTVLTVTVQIPLLVQ